MTPVLLGLVAVTSPSYDHPLFKTVLVVHILAAMVWVGGGCALVVLGLIGRSREDPSEVVRELERAARLRSWCFAPASVVLVACGITLVVLGHFSAEMLWVDLALAGWFVSFVLCVGYLIPESGELSHRARALGADAQPVRRLVTRLRVVGACETLVLVLVVIDMVIRPG